jgi:hypothetical protein
VASQVDEIAVKVLRQFGQKRREQLAGVRAEVMQADEGRVASAVALIVELDIVNTHRIAEPVFPA